MAAILTSSAVRFRLAGGAAIAAGMALLVFFSAPFSSPLTLSSLEKSTNFLSNSSQNNRTNYTTVSLMNSFISLPPSPAPSPAPLNSFISLSPAQAPSSLPLNSINLPNGNDPSVNATDNTAVNSSGTSLYNTTLNYPSPSLLLPPPPPSHPVAQNKDVWSMAPEEQLVYAKKEIDSAPQVWWDQEVHAPLFRNLSVFKRSYELMENMLKVYIYQEGPRPIFHTPILRGIYASEGWFMKLMEENQKYVVKDPYKAHLFYLAYSARQLQIALYVPNSHKSKPLLRFLKNYVDSIAAKYPFWNRTKGADHFLVACHDWGPKETRMHDELRRYAIKAVCNADTSGRIFIRGKDVSLPETNVRIPNLPSKDIGGKPVSKRTILAFYAGQDHGHVRPILRKYWEGKDKDMKIFGPLPKSKQVRKTTMSYIQYMKSSMYCICPRGYEVNSPRIVEAIHYECVPVIIADNFVLPFEEVLNWSAFSVVIAEKDIPNLKNILLKISKKKYITMQNNVRRLQKHFLWHAKPIKYDLFHMILHSIWFNRLNQIQI